ncbi:ubinuclein-1 [Platysternon megacephalum]|uniref:Ubinuclein-1 n=1 Tax=Platysternon megacephalum TaxID=55544 RepID=A0A4D9EM77_9SAUR|nr:ubinuclein-1 [Platysternon megacephalum]
MESGNMFFMSLGNIGRLVMECPDMKIPNTSEEIQGHRYGTETWQSSQEPLKAGASGWPVWKVDILLYCTQRDGEHATPWVELKQHCAVSGWKQETWSLCWLGAPIIW